MSAEKSHSWNQEEVSAQAPASQQHEELSPRLLRRMQDREEWAALWKIRKMDAEGKILPTIRYYANLYSFDKPVTFFREKIVEPLNDRFHKKYYHRKLTRVPYIDECGVSDKACILEAQEQYRLDKLVDTYILQILRQRVDRCLTYNRPYVKPCGPLTEEYEENELNWFIKYGELGSTSDAIDVLMKQKHRMIWERRHPEIMEERARKLAEHKEQLANGDYDHSFWKKGLFYMDKKRMEPAYDMVFSKPSTEGDKPLSKNWEYYKKLQEDPEFDKEQGRKSKFTLL